MLDIPYPVLCLLLLLLHHHLLVPGGNKACTKYGTLVVTAVVYGNGAALDCKFPCQPGLQPPSILITAIRWWLTKPRQPRQPSQPRTPESLLLAYHAVLCPRSPYVISAGIADAYYYTPKLFGPSVAKGPHGTDLLEATRDRLL